jgi:hypothetical protein
MEKNQPAHPAWYQKNVITKNYRKIFKTVNPKKCPLSIMTAYS